MGDTLTAIELAESLLYLGDEAKSLNCIFDSGIIRETLYRIKSTLFLCHAVKTSLGPYPV